MMKKLITTCFFLSILGASAQKDQTDGLAQAGESPGYMVPGNNLVLSNDISLNETFEEAAKRNGIAHKKIPSNTEIEGGYYIIANAFSKEKDANKAIKKLNKKGFSAESISDPKHGLHYVSLEHYPYGLEAVDACVSQLEGRYTEEVWILDVAYPEASKDITPLENVDYNTLLTAEETDSPKLTDPPVRSKVIQRADLYFDKMWYAEAAELYEKALGKSKKNHSFDILRKAGDAHYFNTNMEQASIWYGELYDNHKDDMSADYIFKYSHALKGIGRYTKSKRMMRIYDRMMEKSEPLEKELILDELLAKDADLEVKNLSINSEYSDFGPVFLNDDQVVFSSARDSSFFSTRRYKWNDQPFLDLYVAQVDSASKDLKDAEKLSKNINTKYHEASVAFSPDKRVMYFTRNNYGKKLKRDKDGINHLKIYTSKWENGEWSEAVEVPFNNDNYSTGHPTISTDGKQMYFVSDMPGTMGETDIFVVDVLEENSFSEPRNLGPSINTERREMFPSFTGKKLHFSSDGHVGLGGLDVYEASYDPESGFGDPVNLGKPINSNKDDFSYVVKEGAQVGYFASNRTGGKGDDDIYFFSKPTEEIVPVSINAISGMVIETLSGEPVAEVKVELLDENGNSVKEVVADDDGTFLFEDLEPNAQYTLKTSIEDFFDAEKIVTTKDNETIEEVVELRRLKEMIAQEDGLKKLKTENIHFDFDRHNIRSDAAAELDKLVEVMNQYASMVIKIESHTDSRGNKAYNKYLSDKRAKSTRDYLISQGIAAERIESATGYGEDRLLNECNGSVRCTEEEHYYNRRSEFIIVNM
ncbi:MAG: OmpA family protein [Bacteroidota bacterium]